MNFNHNISPFYLSLIDAFQASSLDQIKRINPTKNDVLIVIGEKRLIKDDQRFHI